MNIYHTATQEDYDALMFEFNGQGKVLIDGDSATSSSVWSI